MRLEREEEEGRRDVTWILFKKTLRQHEWRKRKHWTGSDGEARLAATTPNMIKPRKTKMLLVAL